MQQIWHEQRDKEKLCFSLFQISDVEQTCHGYVVLMCKLELFMRVHTEYSIPS